MPGLADYKIKFQRNTLLGSWHWRVTAPDGRELVSAAPLGFATRAAAEDNALRRIELDRATETIDGEVLARRVAERSASAAAHLTA